MILSNRIPYGGITMVKILLVEDNASLRQSLKEIIHLQFTSMVIEEAAEGDEALRKVGTFLPNLIFMDIKLPGKSGLYLTKKIKKDHPEIIIVILTCYDSPEYRDAAFECGADRFIAKGALIWQEIEALIRSISSDLDNHTSD
jgi:YesN/AraC family two-component response regulator